MLRWSEELRVGFCADRILFARVARGFKPRVVEKRIIDVPAEDSQPAWKLALELLAKTLQEMRGPRVSCFVVLSNRFVRYAIVPWHDALLKRDERLVQARHCFKQVYGDVAGNWSVALTKGRYGAPILATAVDRGLIEGLRASFSPVRFELESITPYLTAAYGHFRRALGETHKSATCFSVVEEGDVGVLNFDVRGLQNAFSRRIREEWSHELRGALLQNTEEGKEPSGAPGVCLFAPGRAPGSEQGLGGKVLRLSLSSLEGFSPLTDSKMSMALVGIR